MGQITSRITNTITDSQSENLTHERVASKFRICLHYLPFFPSRIIVGVNNSFNALHLQRFKGLFLLAKYTGKITIRNLAEVTDC